MKNSPSGELFRLPWSYEWVPWAEHHLPVHFFPGFRPNQRLRKGDNLTPVHSIKRTLSFYPNRPFNDDERAAFTKMQPTTDEIQREIDSIRSMRRISSQTGPGSLTLDPDLPQSPSGSSAAPSSATRQSPTSPYTSLTASPTPGLPGTCFLFCPVANPALTVSSHPFFFILFDQLWEIQRLVE